MNFAAASSKFSAGAHARAGAEMRAPAAVAKAMLQAVVLTPRSPDPGRP